MDAGLACVNPCVQSPALHRTRHVGAYLAIPALGGESRRIRGSSLSSATYWVWGQSGIHKSLSEKTHISQQKLQNNFSPLVSKRKQQWRLYLRPVRFGTSRIYKTINLHYTLERMRDSSNFWGELCSEKQVFFHFIEEKLTLLQTMITVSVAELWPAQTPESSSHHASLSTCRLQG